MENIFNLINTQLTTNIPAIRWVDWDMQQTTFDIMPTSWPAVLIDIPQMDLESRGNYQKIADTEVKLSCYFKKRERSHSKTNPAYKPIAFKHFETINKIIANIEGLQNKTISALCFTRYNRTPKKEYYVYELYFRTAIYDYSNSIFSQQTETLTAPPNITTNYEDHQGQ